MVLAPREIIQWLMGHVAFDVFRPDGFGLKPGMWTGRVQAGSV